MTIFHLIDSIITWRLDFVNCFINLNKTIDKRVKISDNIDSLLISGCSDGFVAAQKKGLELK